MGSDCSLYEIIETRVTQILGNSISNGTNSDTFKVLKVHFQQPYFHLRHADHFKALTNISHRMGHGGEGPHAPLTVRPSIAVGVASGQ